MTEGRTFLIVSLRYIGDILLSTVLARSIKAALPDASVDYLVFEGSQGILEGNSDVRRVLTTRPASWDWRDAVRRFREYDVAIGVNASDRTAFQLLMKGKTTVGFTGPRANEMWKRALLTHATPYDHGLHTVEQLLGQLRHLGIPPVAEVTVRLEEDDLAAARTVAGDGPFVLIHPYTRWIFKMWGPEKWAALHRLIEEESGIRALFTTAPGPVEEGIRREIIASGIPREAFVREPLPIRRVGGLIALSTAYVGIDTMVTHLSAAIGKPTVAVFGPTPVVRWGPWINGSPSSPWREAGGTQRVGHVAIVRGECHGIGGYRIGCDRMGCEHRKDSHSRCLDDLPLEEVYEQLALMLPAGSPSR
jgi:heptosyltransferase-3